MRFEEEPAAAEAPSLPFTLRRIHEKLKDPAELYKLHLKHHHMNVEQFKRRTAAVQIPKEIYDLYGQLVKKCAICHEHKKAPSRAKTQDFVLKFLAISPPLIMETCQFLAR